MAGIFNSLPFIVRDGISDMRCMSEAYLVDGVRRLPAKNLPSA